jgi:hypothetical protein
MRADASSQTRYPWAEDGACACPIRGERALGLRPGCGLGVGASGCGSAPGRSSSQPSSERPSSASRLCACARSRTARQPQPQHGLLPRYRPPQCTTQHSAHRAGRRRTGAAAGAREPSSRGRSGRAAAVAVRPDAAAHATRARRGTARHRSSRARSWRSAGPSPRAAAASTTSCGGTGTVALARWHRHGGTARACKRADGHGERWRMGGAIGLAVRRGKGVRSEAEAASRMNGTHSSSGRGQRRGRGRRDEQGRREEAGGEGGDPACMAMR